MAVPDRITWAVARVGAGVGTRVLEIGYGHGFAVDLLCRAGALVTGVDRSPRMLEVASRRNAAHIAAGTADLRVGEVQDTTFDGRFDAVLAVNVNLFWTGDATRELAAIAAALAPGGALHLCYETPSAAQAEAVAARLASGLPGFTVRVATASRRVHVRGDHMVKQFPSAGTPANRASSQPNTAG